MKNSDWRFNTDFVPGNFYSAFVDEDASRERGVVTDDIAFGLFKGQLLKISGDQAIFQFADGENAPWKMSINLATGLSGQMGVVVSAIDPIDFKTQGFKTSTLEAAVERMIAKRVSGPAPVIEISLGKEKSATKIRA